MNETIKNIIASIGLLAAMFYFFENAYRNAYLGIFGLTINQFDVSAYNAIAFGGGHLLFTLISPTISSIELILALFLFYFSAVISQRNIHFKNRLHFKNLHIGKNIFYAFLAFMFAVISLHRSAHDSGENVAHTFIERRDLVDSPKSVIKYNNKEITGNEITCAQDRCAYLSNDNIVVIPNPNEVKEIYIFLPFSKYRPVSKP